MLQVLVSPTALKVVQCDFISVWEMRFIFKKRRISNVHASRFVLTICLGRFEVMFHILGNASISSISIVAISNRMIAQRLLFNLSKQPANALVWGGALVVLLWTQREKSENEICFLPCRPQMRTYLKSHIGEKPNKCSLWEYLCSGRSALRKPLKSHSGEKQNYCNWRDFRPLVLECENRKCRNIASVIMYPSMQAIWGSTMSKFKTCES